MWPALLWTNNNTHTHTKTILKIPTSSRCLSSKTPYIGTSGYQTWTTLFCGEARQTSFHNESKRVTGFARSASHLHVTWHVCDLIHMCARMLNSTPAFGQLKHKGMRSTEIQRQQLRGGTICVTTTTRSLSSSIENHWPTAGISLDHVSRISGPLGMQFLVFHLFFSIEQKVRAWPYNQSLN